MAQAVPMSEFTITSEMIEGAAQELHHLASRGESWYSAHFDVRAEFHGHAQRILAAAVGAEVAARAKAETILPKTHTTT
jgi:hypothetical protein